MTELTAENEYRTALATAGLDAAALEPWETWKVFKAFLRRDLEGGYDAASVQITANPADPGSCSVLLVRQLSERDESGEDTPFWQLVTDLQYGASLLPLSEVELWTLDFQSLEEFASVVEAQPTFQRAMALRPRRSEVFTGEI